MSKFSVLGGLWAWRQICGNKGEGGILGKVLEEGQCQSWWDIVAHLDQISVTTSEVDTHDRTFCSSPGDHTRLIRDITSLRCLIISSKGTSLVRSYMSQEPSRWTALISNSFPIICKLYFWSSKHSTESSVFHAPDLGIEHSGIFDFLTVTMMWSRLYIWHGEGIW